MNDAHEQKRPVVPAGIRNRCRFPQHVREDIVNGSEWAVSWTLCEKGKTALMKLVKEIAFIRSISNTDPRILEEVHTLGVEKNLIVKVAFNLAESLYSAQKDQKDNHA